MRNSLFFIFLLIFAVNFYACKSFSLGGENIKTLPLVPRDYQILGTIRLEKKAGRLETSYDGLLKEAREQYGTDADVINIKMDKMRRLKKQYVILNAYVIRYK